MEYPYRPHYPAFLDPSCITFTVSLSTDRMKTSYIKFNLGQSSNFRGGLHITQRAEKERVLGLDVPPP